MTLEIENSIQLFCRENLRELCALPTVDRISNSNANIELECTQLKIEFLSFGFNEIVEYLMFLTRH